MLKIVFSLGMVTLLLMTGTLNAQSNETLTDLEIVEDQGNFSLEISHSSLDEPFKFLDTMDIYEIKTGNIEIYECDEYFGVYGHFVTLSSQGNRIRQGFVLIFDESGNVYLDELYTGENGDYFVSIIHKVEDSFLVVKNHNEFVGSQEGGSTEFSYRKFHFYDSETLLNDFKSTINFRQSHILRDNTFYILKVDQHNERSYYGIQDSSGFMREGDLTHLESKTYYEAVEINTLGSFEINGETYYDYRTVDYPGHYTVKTNQTTKHFTIATTIEGVEDGKVYRNPLTVEVSKGQLFLNDKAFLNGGSIDEVGHYTLVVNGVNGYEKIVNFTVDSGIEGVEDGALYKEAPTISFNGTGYLNGYLINSDTSVHENGQHSLVIEGEGGYERIIAFEVAIDEAEDGFVSMEMGIIFSALFVGLVAVFAVYKKR